MTNPARSGCHGHEQRGWIYTIGRILYIWALVLHVPGFVAARAWGYNLIAGLGSCPRHNRRDSRGMGNGNPGPEARKRARGVGGTVL